MTCPRPLPTLAILLSTLLLSACLVRMAYNNADWLLVWRLDDFFDLSSAQEDFLSTRLQEHLRWHRATELEKTIVFLRRTQAAAADGMSKNELEGALAEFTTLRHTLATRLAADSAEFFAQVSDQQLNYLQSSLKKTNKDWEKRLTLPPQERREDRTERILNIVTDWFGPLSNAQEQQLIPSIEGIPDVLGIWLTHTKERQRQFVELVRNARDDRTIASRALVAWIASEGAPPALNAHRVVVYQLVLEVDALCTQKQREHFKRKLQEWIDDLQTAKNQGSA